PQLLLKSGSSSYSTATLLCSNGDFSARADRVARRLQDLHHDHIVLQRVQPGRLELAARDAGQVADGVALPRRQRSRLARLFVALLRQADPQPLAACRHGIALLTVDFEILAAERPVTGRLNYALGLGILD